MRGWEWLLGIMVIAEMVWILSSLFRGNEDERRGQGQRPGPHRGEGAAPGRPRAATSNVDRFLEEINRRRREAAERPNIPRQPGAPAMTPRPPVRSQGPRRLPLPSDDPARTRAPRLPAGGAGLPSVKSAADKDIAEIVVVGEAVPSTQQGPRRKGPPVASHSVIVGEARQAPILAVPPTPTGKIESPPLALLSQLLRNTEMLRTAFVLQEVLGLPRCRRPLGRARHS
jgi:hypothetical protein